MRTFASIDEYTAVVGEELGVSAWVEVDQGMVDAFADVTRDRQWIHVDRDRAVSGPWGTTIAHGFLTLSLVPSLIESLWRVEGVGTVINYGLDRVRFPSVVPAGSRVRARAELAEVEDHAQGHRSRIKITIEVQGSERPACVADFLSLMISLSDAAAASPDGGPEEMTVRQNGPSAPELLRALEPHLTGKVVVDWVNPLGFDKQGAYALSVAEGFATEQAAAPLPATCRTRRRPTVRSAR